MVTIFKKIQNWYRSLRYFIIVDPTDNSVTLSKKLFNHIRKSLDGQEKASVFLFRITDTDLFGFMVNPNIETPTQYCDIQYNGKYKCIGFETLNPSVGRILYDYGLSALKSYKLSVSVKDVKGKIYYQIDKPKVR
ncbi:hypothetical protein [Hoylesella nanceiensis]|uniref:hypothetical protein n=1 Tax=Hoylesella nanceiensis TaxID=425941 RepID=UPI0028E3E81A|nr:hypothetical protein [Hoylesella nanceiensis]